MSIRLLNKEGKKYQDYKTVYNHIRSQRNVTKSRLKELTGLKLTTLNRIVNGLLEEKMIKVIEEGESSGGRRPLMYGIAPREEYIVAVDISRTYMRIALTDLNCIVLKSRVFGMFDDSTPDNTLQKICEIVSDFAIEVGKEKLLGIGIGVVGPIDREKGIILNPVKFPAAGWENISLKVKIERETGLKVIVENGANAAALGEYSTDYGKCFNSLAYIISGVGLRLGMIANGKPAGSENGSDGEFGHITVDMDGDLCTCGKRGCLEVYVSINTILKRFVAEIKRGRSAATAQKLEYDIEAVSLDNFFEAVENNDEAAVEIVKDTANYLSTGMANIINIMNPGLMVLGGVLIKKCDLFYQLSTELTLSKISKHLQTQIKFTKGILEENAVLTGAANLVLNHYLR